jgi:hypothetical protein
MDELPTVGDLVRVLLGTEPTTALVVAEEASGWVRVRVSPVDAAWLPIEKVVVISKAYKKKQDISNKTT